MTNLVNPSSYLVPVSVPIVPPDSVHCYNDYGIHLQFDEALHAITQLPEGILPVTYTVGEPETKNYAANVSALAAEHELPFLEFYGGLALSVKMSGPVDIRSVRIVPNVIREMAGWVASDCIARGAGVGGFVTYGIRGLIDFVIDPTSDLDIRPYPDSTAFLTLLISSHRTSDTSPGECAPAIATILRTAEQAAYHRAGPRYKNLIAERVFRYRRSEIAMRRLGAVRWWDTDFQGNRTAVTNFQHANTTTESVATARRRKRIAGL